MTEQNPLARAAQGGLSRRRSSGETAGAASQGRVTSDLMVEVDSGRHRELKATAALNGITVAAIIRGLITEYLDDETFQTQVNQRYGRI